MNRWHWTTDPWRTFFDIGKVQDEMDRLLGAVEHAVNLRSVPRGTMPTMNVYENTEGVLVRAELPDVEKDSLELSLTDGVLTVKGERSGPELGSSHTVHRRERTHGSFVRSLSLPVPVDPDSCEATLKDGVLEVRMVKSSSARPRQITVNEKS